MAMSFESMLDLLEPVASTAEVARRPPGRCLVLALLALGLVLHAAKMAARAYAPGTTSSARRIPRNDLRFRHSLGAYVCGTGTNAVLPARPGELAKLALVRRKAPGTEYQGLASTLLTESVFDTVAAVVAVAAGIALGWASLGGPGTLVSSHPWLALAAATGVAIGGCGGVAKAGEPSSTAPAGTSRGFSVLRQPRRYLATVVSWQVVALGLRVASILCFLAAFHVPATVGTALVVVCVQSVANLVPLTPNGAGTQQALLVVALGATAGASSVVGFSAGAQLATGRRRGRASPPCRCC